MNLNQVTLKSIDVNRAVEFYLKIGLQLIVDASPRYVRFECPVGDSTFSVSLTDEIKTSSTTLYFEIEDVDAEVQQLISLGIRFESLPQDQKWLWREAVLFDPDGHRLVLFSAGKNRKHPPWRKQSNNQTENNTV